MVLASVRPTSGACVIDNPVEVAETAAGVLAGSNDDAWRRCLDDRQGRLVPCSEEHTGEYIATGEARKANQEECESAAEAYLNQTLANVGDLLTRPRGRRGRPRPELAALPDRRARHPAADRFGAQPRGQPGPDQAVTW